jgi:hypothetical protein
MSPVPLSTGATKLLAMAGFVGPTTFPVVGVAGALRTVNCTAANTISMPQGPADQGGALDITWTQTIGGAVGLVLFWKLWVGTFWPIARDERNMARAARDLPVLA